MRAGRKMVVAAALVSMTLTGGASGASWTYNDVNEVDFTHIADPDWDGVKVTVRLSDWNLHGQQVQTPPTYQVHYALGGQLALSSGEEAPQTILTSSTGEDWVFATNQRLENIGNSSQTFQGQYGGESIGPVALAVGAAETFAPQGLVQLDNTYHATLRNPTGESQLWQYTGQFDSVPPILPGGEQQIDLVFEDLLYQGQSLKFSLLNDAGLATLPTFDAFIEVTDLNANAVPVPAPFWAGGMLLAGLLGVRRSWRQG